MNNTLLQDLRKDYKSKTLDIQDVDPNPVKQFDAWFSETLHSQLLEPNAMTLATASPQGKPSARIVLLKGFDEHGFIFYTNYEGKKAKDLQNNPHAALLFCWLELERQIRIEGTVQKVSHETSDAYFYTRPRKSRLGALASPQSQVVQDRLWLESRFENLEKEYQGKEIPRPLSWGGYRSPPFLNFGKEGEADYMIESNIRILKTASGKSKDWRLNKRNGKDL